jgi:hypothetical protein
MSATSSLALLSTQFHLNVKTSVRFWPMLVKHTGKLWQNLTQRLVHHRRLYMYQQFQWGSCCMFSMRDQCGGPVKRSFYSGCLWKWVIAFSKTNTLVNCW